MRIGSIDRIEPPSDLVKLPIVLVQRPSRLPALGLLILLSGAVTMLLIPLVLIGALAVQDQSTSTFLQNHPLSAAELALALVIACTAVAFAGQRLAVRLQRGRAITISNHQVMVDEHGILSSRRWIEPLAGYKGITTHIRASLSGTRHEVILVHGESARSVLLGFAPRANLLDPDRIAALLGVPVIPTRELYGPAPAFDVAATRLKAA